MTSKRKRRVSKEIRSEKWRENKCKEQLAMAGD